jgi:hypothetical protein
MGEIMGAREVEGQIAVIVAEQTAQLLRDLDRSESRLDSVEDAIRGGIARSMLG